MTAKKQTKPAAEAGTLVYCGPTIPGVAKQFTSYQGASCGRKPAPFMPCTERHRNETNRR